MRAHRARQFFALSRVGRRVFSQTHRGGGHFFFQKRPPGAHLPVAKKAFLHHAARQRVIHRQKAHADVVRHVTAHQRKALSCIFAVHKIDRFVKAEASHSAHFPQLF